MKISDTQTGLRAFGVELLEVEGDRYEYEMNVLMALAKKGPPIADVLAAALIVALIWAADYKFLQKGVQAVTFQDTAKSVNTDKDIQREELKNGGDTVQITPYAPGYAGLA